MVPKWQLTVSPRQWQAEALREWSRQYRGVVSVVTGAGKTIFAHLCMLELLKKYPSARFIIVVPTIALQDQWCVSLLEDLCVSQSEISQYSGQGRAKKPASINVVVINSARTLIRKIADREPTCLIVDECHRAGSPENSRALAGSHVAALGISATPVRDYDDGFERRISPALGPIVYEYGYEEARKDGIIVPFELVNVRVDLLEDEARLYNNLTRHIARHAKSEGEDECTELALTRLLQRRAAVASSAAMRVPVAAKLAEQHKGERMIIFHERIEAANAIVGVLQKRGISATVYHTKVGPHLRQENLRLFRRGVFDCVVTCRALDEGLNVPDVRVGIIASSTSSTRQRIQRTGRVLRPSQGKDGAIVYTIYATDAEEKRLSKEALLLRDTTDVRWMIGSAKRDD